MDSNTNTNERRSSDDHLAFELALEDLAQECENLEYENSVFENFLLRQLQGARKEARRVSTLAASQRRKSTSASSAESTRSQRKKSVHLALPEYSGIIGVPSKTESLEELKIQLPTLTEEDIEAWVGYYNTISTQAPSESRRTSSEDDSKIEMSTIVSVAMDKKGIQAQPNKILPDKSSQKVSPVRSPLTSLSNLNCVTAKWKCAVILSELEATRQAKATKQYETLRTIETIGVDQEELDTKGRDHQKTHFEFVRDFSKTMFDEQKQKYDAEPVMRYFEDTKRAKEAYVTKLRMKLSTMIHQKNKCIIKLKQKEELGDVLNEVDHEQLKFENEQYQEQIVNQNGELHALKSQCMGVVGQCSRMKTTMKDLEASIQLNSQEIKQKELHHRKIEDDGLRVNFHICEVKEELARLTQRLEGYRVPTTKSYILQTMKLDELRLQIKSWTRKVETAKLKLKGTTHFWNKICEKQRTIDARAIEISKIRISTKKFKYKK